MPRKGKRSAALKQRWQKFGESQQSVPAEQLVSSPPHSNREVHVPQPSHANVTRVLASRSQMHKKYADSKNSQCTCNSATFLAFLHELKHLQSADLDLVLDRGHAMYALTLSQLIADGRHVHTHLNTEVVPEVVLGYRQTETNKADSNADVTTDLNPMSSVTQAESETSVPSCSVTQSTVCVDSTPDVNELLHVTTSEGPVEYPTSDTTKHDNEHVPDLSKYSRQEKKRLKKRALAMGKKKVTQAETATSLPSCSVTEGSDADITVSHMREQDRETMSSITQAEVETSLPSCSVTECTPCADNTQDTNELMHVSSSEGTVAYPTLDTPQHHSQHMPDLSKLTKQQRLKVKNRLMAMENKIASQVEKNRRIEIQKMEKNRKEREKYTKDQFCTKQKKSRQCYRQNVEYRKRKMSYITTRYKQDSSFQQRQTLYIRKHYSQDIGFQQKQRTYVTKRYSQDPGFQQKQRTYVTKRYSQDPGFQQKQRTYVTKRYSQDPGFQQKQRTYVTKRYSQDPGFQQKQRTYVTKRYSQDPGFQQKQRTYITKRYSQDPGFQQRKRSKLKYCYQSNAHFRQTRKSYMTNRYGNDCAFRSKQKETMRRLMRDKYRAFRMSNNVRCALKIRRKPETPEFEAMCLADFAATCRILYGKQARGKNAIPLLNQMGFVQKRTNEKPAVIKYHIVSEEKFPEQFHRTLLKLYLPHRSEGQLKSVHFPTYKSFHECACVQPPDLDHLVRVAHIVKLNRDKYEKHREDIESAISEYEQNGIIRNEWCNLAPESELERLECITELDARQNDDDNVQENVPDLMECKYVMHTVYIVIFLYDITSISFHFLLPDYDEM
ncbi:hypothetical protein ABVT39_025630 [Epinephelus coioides]